MKEVHQKIPLAMPSASLLLEVLHTVWELANAFTYVSPKLACTRCPDTSTLFRRKSREMCQVLKVMGLHSFQAEVWTLQRTPEATIVKSLCPY